MSTLKLIPIEETYYESIGEVMDLEFRSNIIVCGNSQMSEYGYQVHRDIVKHKFYDDELAYDYDVLEELEKLTGKKWVRHTMRGYNQGDWQDIYYVEDKVSKGQIEDIEMYYMNKYREVFNEADGDTYHVPDDVVWKGKDAICNYLGFDPKETKVLQDCGYYKVFRYEEMQ